MKARALPFLLLPLLAACQDTGARQENAALTRRVAALEAEVRALKAAQAAATAEAGGMDRADQAAFEARSAAQNCANELARTLETFRELSVAGRYPPPAQLELPTPRAGQRVNWLKLEAQAYAFTVTDAAGLELARQSGP